MYTIIKRWSKLAPNIKKLITNEFVLGDISLASQLIDTNKVETICLLKDNNSIVGVAYLFDLRRTPKVMVYVPPHLRRKGYAKKLIQSSERFLKRNNFSHYLVCPWDNASTEFFHKIGTTFFDEKAEAYLINQDGLPYRYSFYACKMLKV